MKAVLTLTLLLSCLAVILADANNTKRVVQGCIKDNGVSEQDLLDLQSGKVKPKDAKDNIKCASQCILVKSGYMDSSGKLLVDHIKSIFANTEVKDRVAKDLERCSKIKGDNPCDTAFLMLGCFQGGQEEQ